LFVGAFFLLSKIIGRETYHLYPVLKAGIKLLQLVVLIGITAIAGRIHQQYFFTGELTQRYGFTIVQRDIQIIN
jgi:hypothetical protein